MYKVNRFILVTGVFILTCVILVVAFPAGEAKTDGGICIWWDITGTWSYKASWGGYGTMQFLQDSEGKITGSWYNAANGASGTLEGSIIGASLGFIVPESEEDFQGTVNVNGDIIGGTFSLGDQSGTWEASGAAQCLKNQPPPPPGTVTVTMRWSDNVYRYYPGSDVSTLLPAINFLGPVTLNTEVVIYDTDLPDKLKVFDDLEGNLIFLGYLNPAGETTDGGARYTGYVTVRQSGPIGSGMREYHKVRIGYHKDYQPVESEGLSVDGTRTPSDAPAQLQPTLTPTPDDVLIINQYLIDPSGYLYDTSNNARIEGANVAVYEKQGSEFLLWNAFEFLQTNPQASDEEGRYGWDVPEGDYQVRASKQCYTNVDSEVMHIPPERKDVNLGMTPVGCSSVKIASAWTTDNEGSRDDKFSPGEQVELHSTITNTATSDITVDVDWTVSDPEGKRVEALSGTGTYVIAPFGANLKHDVTIPAGSTGGIYRYTTSFTYQNQTSIMSTQFFVLGGNSGNNTYTYMPLVLRTIEQSPPPAEGINGEVTYNGGPATGIDLQMRHYDGWQWSTVMTTTTGSDGGYQFTGLPSLDVFEQYVVRYGLNDSDSRYISYWIGNEISSYTAGENTAGGDFDIVAFNLLSPNDDASLNLPTTFTWERRGISGDMYSWYLTDYYGSVYWETTDLGDVSSYTLTSLPSGFDYGETYYWTVLVYNGLNGYGLPDYRNIIFWE